MSRKWAFDPKEIFGKCWELAQRVPGRDPNRWRLDGAGWPVLKPLRQTGICAYNFDHIRAPVTPEEKEDKAKEFSSLENCQLLNAKTNKVKGNKNLSDEKLKGSLPDIKLSDAMMDFAEILIFGDIKDENGKIIAKAYTKDQMDKGRLPHKFLPYIVPLEWEKGARVVCDKKLVASLLKEMKTESMNTEGEYPNKSLMLARKIYELKMKGIEHIPQEKADARMPDVSQIRLANLPPETTDLDVFKVFSQFGTLTDVSVKTRAGSCTGLGSVTFVNKEDGEKAMKMLNGLKVEWAGAKK